MKKLIDCWFYNTSRKDTRISIFRIPKAKSGILEHKNGNKKYKNIYFFSFMRLCSKSASCNIQLHDADFHSCSIAVVFFIKVAIAVAILGKKTFHGHLSYTLWYIQL